MRPFLLSGAAGAVAGVGAALVAVCALAGAGVVRGGPLLAVGSTLGIGLSVVGSLLLVLEALGAAQALGRALDTEAAGRLISCAGAVLFLCLAVMCAAAAVWVGSMHPDRPGLVAAAVLALGVTVVAGARSTLRLLRHDRTEATVGAGFDEQWAAAWRATERAAPRNWP